MLPAPNPRNLAHATVLMHPDERVGVIGVADLAASNCLVLIPKL